MTLEELKKKHIELIKNEYYYAHDCFEYAAEKNIILREKMEKFDKLVTALLQLADQTGGTVGNKLGNLTIQLNGVGQDIATYANVYLVEEITEQKTIENITEARVAAEVQKFFDMAAAPVDPLS